jgi:hypothetical protein
MAQDISKHTFVPFFFVGQMHIDVSNQLPSFNYKQTNFTCNSRGIRTCIGIWVGHDKPCLHTFNLL